MEGSVDVPALRGQHINKLSTLYEPFREHSVHAILPSFRICHQCVVQYKNGFVIFKEKIHDLFENVWWLETQFENIS